MIHNFTHSTISCISANKPGSNSSVRGGRYGEKDTSVSRAELRQLQNSLVEDMEKMFDERLPMVSGRAKQHSAANSCRGLFGTVDNMEEVLMGIAFAPVC